LHLFVNDRKLLQFSFVLVENFIIEFLKRVAGNDIEADKKQVLKVGNVPVTGRFRPSDKFEGVISIHKIKIGDGKIFVIEIVLNEKLINL
jgi:hypothetical protein